MSDQSEQSQPQPRQGGSTSDERLYELIAAYLDATREGRSPDRDRLLSERPDSATELDAFLRDHDRLRQLVESPPSHASAVELAERNGAVAPDPQDLPTLAIGQALESSQATGSHGASLRRFGDYELLEMIARGGMGAVYKARQIGLNRIVAVKMILAGELASAEEIARYWRGIRIEARSRGTNWDDCGHKSSACPSFFGDSYLKSSILSRSATERNQAANPRH